MSVDVSGNLRPMCRIRSRLRHPTQDIHWSLWKYIRRLLTRPPWNSHSVFREDRDNRKEQRTHLLIDNSLGLQVVPLAVDQIHVAKNVRSSVSVGMCPSPQKQVKDILLCLNEFLTRSPPTLGTMFKWQRLRKKRGLQMN